MRQFRGQKEIKQKLLKLAKPSAFANEIRKALYQAAVPIRDDARIFASMVKPRKKKKRASKMLWKGIKIIRHRAQAGRHRVSVRGVAPHSYLVEFGSGPRYRHIEIKDRGVGRKRRRRLMDLKAGRGHRKGYTGIMPARPYMRPAYAIHRAAAARQVLKDMKLAVFKNARG